MNKNGLNEVDGYNIREDVQKEIEKKGLTSVIDIEHKINFYIHKYGRSKQSKKPKIKKEPRPIIIKKKEKPKPKIGPKTIKDKFYKENTYSKIEK